MCSKEIKLLLLEEIEKNKIILFGSFSDKITKKEKSDIWMQIHEKAKSNGFFCGKSWSYIRDVFWTNIKRCTMVKVDNRKKTGSGGGLDARLNEIDNKVLDILEKDAPDIIGLPVPESLHDDVTNESSGIFEETELDMENQRFPSQNTSCSRKSKKNPSTSSEPKRKYILDDEIAQLKKEKLVLEIENLKKQNKKLDMEIEKLDLEKKMLSNNLIEKECSILTIKEY